MTNAYEEVKKKLMEGNQGVPSVSELSGNALLIEVVRDTEFVKAVAEVDRLWKARGYPLNMVFMGLGYCEQAYVDGKRAAFNEVKARMGLP